MNLSVCCLNYTCLNYLRAGCAFFLTILFLVILLAGCTTARDIAEPLKKGALVPTEAHAKDVSVTADDSLCRKVTGSECEEPQEDMLGQFLKDMDVYGYLKRNEGIDGAAPAFELLPKDKFGLVNWTKAEVEGLISPRGSIDGSDDSREESEEGFFENMIRLDVAVKFFPDVLFPHGTHSSMLSCDSCHPEPFKKEVGADNIQMAEIFEGKWCGKCHGIVAFPVTYPVQEPFNCRRCHMLRKKSEHS